MIVVASEDANKFLFSIQEWILRLISEVDSQKVQFLQDHFVATTERRLLPLHQKLHTLGLDYRIRSPSAICETPLVKLVPPPETVCTNQIHPPITMQLHKFTKKQANERIAGWLCLSPRSKFVSILTNITWPVWEDRYSTSDSNIPVNALRDTLNKELVSEWIEGLKQLVEEQAQSRLETYFTEVERVIQDTIREEQESFIEDIIGAKDISAETLENWHRGSCIVLGALGAFEYLDTCMDPPCEVATSTK